MKECPQCKRRYDDRSQFCTVDAAPLMQTKKGGAGKVILIVFGVLFGFCALSGIIGSITKSPRDGNSQPSSSSLTSTATPEESPKEAAMRRVNIKKLSWNKGGFNAIMLADFVIENPSRYAVKDIEIKCTHFAPSGTRIDSNTRTIYEVVPAGQTRTFKQFNMGMIHSQAASTSCEITDLEVN